MKDKAKIVVLFSLVVIGLTFVLFAIPEQFAELIPTGTVTKGAMGGFEFIFGGTQEARNLQAHAVDGSALAGPQVDTRQVGLCPRDGVLRPGAAHSGEHQRDERQC